MYNTKVLDKDVINKLHYKACTKCAGDMIYDSSWPDGALRCLQCGMTKDLVPVISEDSHSDDSSHVDNESDKTLVA